MKQIISAITMVSLVGFLVVGAVRAAESENVTATVTIAAVSVTLNQTTFDYGVMNYDTASSTLALWSGAGITATNGGTINADLDVLGASTAGWTLVSATSTINQYIHKVCNDTVDDCTLPTGQANYDAFTTESTPLATAVAPSGTVAFQLQITTPTTGSVYAQQSAVVTVQISAS